MNTSTVIAIAVIAASIALQLDSVRYWIGPAGCLILIPTLVIVLTLPLLAEDSWLLGAKVKTGEWLPAIPDDLARTPAAPPASPPGTSVSGVPAEYDALPRPELGLNERQVSGLRQLSQWIRSFLGSARFGPSRNREFDVLDNAEKIKITERIKPDGVRERSVMIFYRKA